MTTHRVWVSSEACKHAVGEPKGIADPTPEHRKALHEFLSEQASKAGIDPEGPHAGSICEHGVAIIGEGRRRPTSDLDAYRRGWERIFGALDE